VVEVLMRAVLVLAAAAALGLAAAGGCFSPLQVPCAFTCSREHLCPDDFTCGDDGLCHRNGATGECVLTPPDAAADAGGDAASDGAGGS
jgi:hypothetical protein